MNLKFYKPSPNSTPIPSLTLEGKREVETVAAASHIAGRACYRSYPGQNLLRTILPNSLAGLELKFDSLRARRNGLDAYRSVGSIATQEELNHADTPEAQRLVLIESQASTAISALRQLATIDPSEANAKWGASEGVDIVATAIDLFSQIDDAYQNPLPTN